MTQWAVNKNEEKEREKNRMTNTRTSHAPIFWLDSNEEANYYHLCICFQLELCGVVRHPTDFSHCTYSHSHSHSHWIMSSDTICLYHSIDKCTELFLFFSSTFSAWHNTHSFHLFLPAASAIARLYILHFYDETIWLWIWLTYPFSLFHCNMSLLFLFLEQKKSNSSICEAVVVCMCVCREKI